MFRLEHSGCYTCRLWALLGHMKGTQQDITRTLQGLHCRWAHPHTLTPARWHPQLSPTHTPRCQFPPSLPCQACCRCVVSGKVVIEQQGAQQPWGQGCLQGEQHPGRGGGTAQCVTLMGQSTHVPGPKLCPEKLCHWTGQAQTSLRRECAQNIAQVVTTYTTGCGHKGYAAHQ